MDKRVTRSQSRSKSPKKAKKESSPKKKVEKKASKSPVTRASKSKSPKKKIPPKKKPRHGITVHRTTKPTYNIMIAKAIHELGELRNGSSSIAIGKYIQRTYPVPKDFTRHLRVALKKAENNGHLSRNKNSYKLTDKGGKYLLSKRDQMKRVVTEPKKRVVKSVKKSPIKEKKREKKEKKEKKRKKRKKCIP